MTRFAIQRGARVAVHPPRYVPASSGFQFLADDYTFLENGWSLRKLRDDYAGNWGTIRRLADSGLLTVGFVDNFIDTAAIDSHCTGDTCVVTEILDQIGSVDLDQGIDGEQPTIYTGGAITTDAEGNQSIHFDTVGDELNSSSLVYLAALAGGTGCCHSCVVGHKTVSTGSYAIYGNASGFARTIVRVTTSDTRHQAPNRSTSLNLNVANPASDTVEVRGSYTSRGAENRFSAYSNGSQLATVALTADVSRTTTWNIRANANTFYASEWVNTNNQVIAVADFEQMQVDQSNYWSVS